MALLALLATLPLLWPDIPPLVDLPGHMGRYHIELNLESSPGLQRFYRFEWALIGNLGVDLLIIPLAKLFGLELATKLVVLAIPALTVLGCLWVAREVHGRIPPTALLSVPFAYGHPFIFGFVNFSLSMALAFLAFALWLRLARQGRLRLRAILFVPVSLILWLCHTFGWGTLGVMAFSAELIRQHDRGRSYAAAALRAALHCLPMALPLLPMVAWRQGHVAGETGDWFNLRAKLLWLVMALRDRWQWLDLGSVVLVLLTIFAAIRSPRLSFSRNLAASALFLLLVFILLPRIVFGSAYADMRLAPYLLAVGVIAIRLRDEASEKMARGIAILALAFALVRIGATSWSFLQYDRSYDRELAAIDHIPQDARLVSFVGLPCPSEWRMSRLEHLPALALIRRNAFSNDQWSMAGAQLATAIYAAAPGYRGDPSQLIAQRSCPNPFWRSIETSLQGFPRDAFDYVWLIQAPEHDPRLLAGLEPVWRDGDSALYRVVDRRPPAG